MIVIVTRKSDGEEVTRYAANAITEAFDGKNYPLTEFDHAEYIEDAVAETPVDPVLWRIDVGSFFDRFGDAKLAILASENTIVKAMITDASVRKYISLIEREAKLRKALAAAQSATRGLRDDLATLGDRLSESSVETCRTYIATLSHVLGECSERYSEVAGTADQCVSDLQQVTEAWPK